MQLACSALASVAALSTAVAQDTSTRPPAVTAPTVNVFASEPRRAATEVTEDATASPASVTLIDRKALDRQTITTYGDVLRGVTGLNVLEYGQGLVAYGITARGFDESHGRNIAVYLDGMPLNVTGSQHTNGYMDLAQLIPELISRVEFVRGPFSVLAGNHAVAGSIQLYTDASPRSSVKFTLDSFGRARVLPIHTFDAGPGKLLVAFDGTKGSAYTKQSDIERLNFLTRYLLPTSEGLLSARLQFYDAEADAPGWLDADRLRSGAIGLKEALSKGIGDAKQQQNLVFNYRSDDAEGRGGITTGLSVSVYFNNDIRKRWTNFDLTTPLGANVNLNQERDHLHQRGLDIRKVTTFMTAGMPSQLLVGAQYNYEGIDARNFVTNGDRVPTGTVNVDRRVVTQTSSLLAQYQVQPVPKLKLTAGLRFDQLDFDITLNPNDNTYGSAVTAGQPTTVSRTPKQFSPKLGAAWEVFGNETYRTELFANQAKGFKSPYPFSDYFTNLGVTGSLPSLSISPLRSRELGLQGGQTDGSTNWRISYWTTRQDNEAGQNAVGIFQSFRETTRRGVDLEASGLVSESLRVFGNYSRVTARIENPVVVAETRIPNVPDSVATLGALGILQSGSHRFDWSVTAQWIGAQAVKPDNSVRTSGFNRQTARIAYTDSTWGGTSVFANLIHYSDQLNEIVFDFGGGLYGTTVKPKWQFLVGVQVPLGEAK